MGPWGQSYKELLERMLDELDPLILYIDSIVIGGHGVLVAIGVDTAGYTRVLGRKPVWARTRHWSWRSSRIWRSVG